MKSTLKVRMPRITRDLTPRKKGVSNASGKAIIAINQQGGSVGSQNRRLGESKTETKI